MAQVQLDEVSDVQIANEHVLLGLGVDHTVREEGEIHQDHPRSPATPVLPSLARMLYSLPLNCKFKFVTYVDLAHAGSSAVKKKMDLLKIVPFSPTARSIFGPQYCQALLECCTACHSIAIKFKFQEFASLIPPGLSTIPFLITTGRSGDEALSSTLLGLGQLQNAFAEALKSSYYMYWVYTAAV